MQFHSSYKCTETELNFFHGHTSIQVTTLTVLGKRVIQTNPSKFDKFSDMNLCRLRLKHGTEIHNFIF